MFADHPLPFAETFLMQANYVSWIIQTLKVCLVFWQTPSTKSKEKDIAGERTKSVSWIICGFIYFEHMNDWKDKFHFYVSVEKPSEVKQSFDLYFFLDNLKTNKKQNKWNIHKKKLFQNFVPQETSGAWRSCNMPLKMVSPNVCSVTEWKNMKRGSSSILLLFSRSDFSCSVPLFLFFCRFFYGAVKSVSLFCLMCLNLPNRSSWSTIQYYSAKQCCMPSFSFACSFSSPSLSLSLSLSLTVSSVPPSELEDTRVFTLCCVRRPRLFPKCKEVGRTALVDWIAPARLTGLENSLQALRPPFWLFQLADFEFK